MAARSSSSSSYRFQALATLLHRYRIISDGGPWRSHQALRRQPPLSKVGCGQGLRFISTSSRECSQQKFTMENDQNEPVQPPLPAPSKFSISNWLKWLLGSTASLLLLPFLKNRWDNFLRLEGTAERIVGEVEVVAEVVEQVAATTTEVAAHLPDKSKLKEVAEAMEHVSGVVAQDAQLIENIIQKVGDVKQDLEGLEKIIVPALDKIVQVEHPKV